MSTTSISSTDTSRAEKPINVADNPTTFRIKPTVRTPFVSTIARNSSALAVEQPQADACGDECASEDNPADPDPVRSNDGMYCSSLPNEREKKISACARTTTSRTATTISSERADPTNVFADT